MDEYEQRTQEQGQPSPQEKNSLRNRLLRKLRRGSPREVLETIAHKGVTEPISEKPQDEQAPQSEQLGETEEERRSRLATVRNTLQEGVASTGRVLQSGAERARRAAGEIVSRAQELREHPKVQATATRAKETIKAAPGITEETVLRSRESRIRTEEKNRKRNPINKVFSTTAGKVAKTGFEMLPWTPFGYGAGDLMNIAEGALGRDFLSGEQLDHVDRGIYIAAGLIPFVPATPSTYVARKIRRGIEESVQARKNRDIGGFATHLQNTVESTREMKDILKQKNNPHSS